VQRSRASRFSGDLDGLWEEERAPTAPNQQSHHVGTDSQVMALPCPALPCYILSLAVCTHEQIAADVAYLLHDWGLAASKDS